MSKRRLQQDGIAHYCIYIVIALSKLDNELLGNGNSSMFGEMGGGGGKILKNIFSN